MKIGFTGTRQGMSIRQFGVLRTEFAKRATEFHHWRLHRVGCPSA